MREKLMMGRGSGKDGVQFEEERADGEAAGRGGTPALGH
jgi:hypothetical protein